MLALETHEPWHNSLFDGITALDENSADDVCRLLGTIPFHPKNLSGILRTPLRRSLPINDKVMEVFRATAKIDDWYGGAEFFPVTDLSMPFLDKESLLSLYHSSETSDIAKMAMADNPDMPTGIRLNHPMRQAVASYMIAVAKYGNLGQEDTVAEIAKAARGLVFKQDINFEIAEALLRRDRLPEKIVLALDESLGQQTHNVLASKPYYRDFVPKPGSGELARIITRRNVKLGADIDEATLCDVYKLIDAPDWRNIYLTPDTGRAAVACHPNAPKHLMVNALSSVDVRLHLAQNPMLASRPHAEMAVREICGAAKKTSHMHRLSSLMAAIPDCSAGGLVWALERGTARRSSFVPIISHRNFPWKRYQIKDIVGFVPGGQFEAAMAIMNLNGKLDENDTAALLDGKHSHAALFSPSLSARRLDALAVKRPELAAVCAMHPNGGDIVLPLGDPSERIVASFRDKFHVAALSGRGTPAPGDSVSVLRI